MQLAGTLFLDRSDRTMRRKIQETLPGPPVERHYTKQQIFTMYCNQIYLSHGNYGFEAASEYYFGKPVGKLTLPEAALLAGMIRGPSYSPIAARRSGRWRGATSSSIVWPARTRSRRRRQRRRLRCRSRCTWRRRTIPWRRISSRDIRKYLEGTYGTQTVHERGLRVYTTLNVGMQRAANQAIRDGLHAYDRRHGWRGNLENILRNHPRYARILRGRGLGTGPIGRRRLRHGPGYGGSMTKRRRLR